MSAPEAFDGMAPDDGGDRHGPQVLDDLSALDREAACLLALAAIGGVGAITVLACHQAAGGAPAAWEALVAGAIDRCPPLASTLRARIRAQAVVAARGIDPVAELARCRSSAVRVLVHGRPGYPARLVDDPAPPAVLFATGPVPGPESPTVAIVGTRNATTLGRTFARRLGADLAAAGVGVVSGLALGIDGAAHRGALEGSVVARGGDGEAGRPIGVVAAGLDIAYPARHEGLHREVAAAGVLVSETPLGCRPSEWRFPARNRIIAGLSDAVVVVESRAAGGSIITADQAAERGVPVLAVPGHPAAAAAAGTNALIFDGAKLVRDADDVLGELGLSRHGDHRPGPEPTRLPAIQQRVVDALAAGPLGLAELVDQVERPLDDVAAALSALEGGGRVVSTGGWFEAAAPARPSVSR